MTPEAIEKANRALKVFRGLQPTLTMYARILTGRPDVRVLAASESNGKTDGTKIFYRPPIELGEVEQHQLWLCDKRSEFGVLQCPACAKRELVLATVYHEIAHIWFESFAMTNDSDKRQALRSAIAERGSKYAKAIEDRIAYAPYGGSYMGLAKLISDFLPLIINALEDARVNRELFKAMPGTQIMFAAKTVKIFEEGVEQMNLATGEWDKTPWKEYPMNMQAICGLFCKASGYKYDHWFHPDVVAALDDEQLTELVRKTGLMSSMADIYGLAFPVLARLRELGYCNLPEDPEVEEEPPPPPPEPPEEPEQEPEEDPDQEPEQEPEQGDGEQDENEEPGETDSAEPDPGESDGNTEPEQAEDADNGDDSSPGGSGEDQQGDDDSPSGDESGENSENNGTDEAPSESEGEPGEPGVGDDSSEGPASDDQEAEGDAGSSGGNKDLDGDGPGDPSGGAGTGTDEVLEEDLHSSGEGGDGATEAAPGDGPGQGDGGPAEGADLPSPGDGDDHLGGEGGLDPTDGEHPGPEDGGPAGEPDPEGGGDGGGLPSEGDSADPEAEPIDTGPFSNGTTLRPVEPPEPPRPEMGTPEECEVGLIKLGDHEPPSEIEASLADEQDALAAAIVQGMYFETPSATVINVDEYEFPEVLYDRRPFELTGAERMDLQSAGHGWAYFHKTESQYVPDGIDGDFDAPESTLAPALLKARIAFSDNLRGKNTAGLKSGKVNPRHLGKRAPVGDERLFRRKLRPSKKSYFVLIGIDISGSTRGKNILLAKQLAMAEAELLSRLGIPFAIMAHSGRFEQSLERIVMHLYHVKRGDQAWDSKAKMRLEQLGPDGINVDGHTIEVYRRVLDARTETTRILHYYTDGAMPAANAGEELGILQREIKEYRRRGYILTGIGIRTDSPTQHGLETIQLEERADIIKVIKNLEEKMTRQ